jgi:hypothetical protein
MLELHILLTSFMYATPLSRLCAAYVTALSRVFKEAAERCYIDVVKGAKRWEI